MHCILERLLHQLQTTKRSKFA